MAFLLAKQPMEPLDEVEEDSSIDSSGSISLYSSSNHTRNIPDVQEEEDKKALNEIGRKEEQAVSRVRIVVLLVLISVAVAVSTVVYLYGYNNELNEFESQFQTHAAKILTTLQEKTELSLIAITGFSSQLTSHAHDLRLTWPNVSLTDFENRAKSTRDLALAISLLFYPIVEEKDREGYEAFTVRNQEWLMQGLSRQRDIKLVDEEIDNILELYELYGDEAIKGDLRIPSEIFRRQGSVILKDEFGGPYAPLWQFAPAVPFAKIVNSNALGHPQRRSQIQALMRLGRTIIGEAVDYSRAENLEVRVRGALLNLFLGRAAKSTGYDGGPVSDLYTPVFDTFDKNRKLVGFLSSDIYWKIYLERIIPENVYGIFVVMSNDCGQTFTYQLTGEDADYLGEGDLHDPNYDEYMTYGGAGSVFDQRINGTRNGDCVYRFEIYPSNAFRDIYIGSTYRWFTIIIAGTFIFASIVLIWYQRLLQRRQKVVLEAAVRSTQVVQELFPANVRDRLFGANQRESDTNSNAMFLTISGNEGAVNSSESIFGSKPIADLFPNTTIMFADLVGFTAWSSVREPTQVFALLETIYHSFDVLAKNMRIFKVETIGDCYVAVAGLPTPRDDHPVAMATFAYCCLCKMRQLTLELEIELGPDTADLSMRIGLHSGPVTAGVLRGDKGRFQLFGDTVNTTSRIESTGERDKVHISRETATLLMDAGKGGWVTPREDKVVAKGKGELQTYWLIIKKGSTTGSSTSTDDLQSMSSATKPFLKGFKNFENDAHTRKVLCEKTDRSINWNVEIIANLLKKILSTRAAREVKAISIDPLAIVSFVEGSCVLDEVKEIITLPKFDASLYEKEAKGIDPASIELATEVMEQLKGFVTEIAYMYNDNPFHNFAHASQVIMSVTKLLTRIVAPLDCLQELKNSSNEQFTSELHKRTFGITSDPLTHLACVISALIHDLDHPGVPNSVLVQEEIPIAAKYRNKSVAEQNSVDLAWDVLMKDDYKDLRRCIYANQEEARRFRQLVVNSVMATDIIDKDLGAKRKARWETAFSEEMDGEQSVLDNVNRKATIVIEHIIQASDIAHTMQHWHIYIRWNENLFHEMYRAYKAGRLDVDPSISWYKGEIGFFDFYIIPLTKKLETCGVFGVSSDEFLNYAMANRQEWIEKGEALVEKYLESYQKLEAEGELT